MGMPPAFSCSPFLISRRRVHSSSSATLSSFSLFLLCSRGSVVDVYVYVLRGDQVVLSEVPSLVIQRGMRSLLLFFPLLLLLLLLTVFSLPSVSLSSRPSVEGTFESLERIRPDQKGKARRVLWSTKCHSSFVFVPLATS